MKTEIQIVEFHKVEIYCPVIDGQIYVAVKPICEAIGVDHSSQVKRIKEDDVLSQLWSLWTTVGADNKQREMVCLPLPFVYGWLFNIDHRAVKPEIRQTVLEYKIECYKALYDHFYGIALRAAKRARMEADILYELRALEEQKANTAEQIKQMRSKLEKIRNTPLEQLDIEFD